MNGKIGAKTMGDHSKLEPGDRSPSLIGKAGLRWNWDFGIGLSDADTHRLLALLTALLDTTALAEAAKTARMSYRAAWGLLRHCEERFGAPLVSMARGRGSRLSFLGESLVEMDMAARKSLAQVHELWEGRMREVFSPKAVTGGTGGRRLLLHASHDLALSDWVEHGRRVPLDVSWHGSDEALSALARGACDLAGFHVPESWSAEQFSLWLGRWLNPRLHACVPVMLRTQGLIVAHGNPLQLFGVADLATKGGRMVNRQRGSGTRTLIDDLFLQQGIDPTGIDGYGHEEFTHDAVAATVASGSADVGFGILAAASRYDLDFVPLTRERYGFALRRAALHSETVQTLLRRMSGSTFRNRLAALPGYEALTSAASGGWEAFLNLREK